MTDSNINCDCCDTVAEHAERMARYEKNRLKKKAKEQRRNTRKYEERRAKRLLLDLPPTPADVLEGNRKTPVRAVVKFESYAPGCAPSEWDEQGQDKP